MTAAAKKEPALPPLPELSSEQAAVVETIKAWHAKATARGAKKRRTSTPRLTFGGWAGSGKTTVIAHLLQMFDAKVCAFTGKAAHVLNTKGVPASTIHRLIYQCFEACDSCDKDPEKCKCERSTFSVRFTRVPVIDAKLVIVDEASMVSATLLEDLESYGVPVLYVGDHGQLEPVGDDPGLMASPDIKLETIHRQAAGSPIIRFAHHLRQGGDPAEFESCDEVIVRRGAPVDLRPYDIVICGFNETRVAVNGKVRRQLGFTGLLEKGERVICRRNNRDHGIFNGMLATVERVSHDRIDVVDDMGTKFCGMPFEPRQLDAPQVLKDVDRDTTLWMRGYCITGHSSQGSEWSKVCVLEQANSRLWDAKRWRYTVATRGAEHLTYCLPTRSR